MAEEMFESTDIITLTDEDGVETDFEVVASLEINGQLYYALMPVENNENGECVILKLEKDEKTLVESLRGKESFKPNPTKEDRNFFDKLKDLFD